MLEKYLFPHKLKMKLSFLLALFLLFPNNLKAQITESQTDNTDDNTEIYQEIVDTSYHDPKKATLYSAIIPGWGQIYNQRIWKVPIIYAGFGTLGYFIDRNSKYYKDLKQKLIDPDYQLKYFDGDFTSDQLTSGKDFYKRWRDLSIIGTVGFYVLQIIDASVDAYMFDWNVGDDISLRIEPANFDFDFPGATPIGLRACISF